MSAVAAGNVIELDDDIASRWGPRVVDFAGAIAVALEDAAVPA
jgi:iron complex transport system substrate-binding protein